MDVLAVVLGYRAMPEFLPPPAKPPKPKPRHRLDRAALRARSQVPEHDGWQPEALTEFRKTVDAARARAAAQQAADACPSCGRPLDTDSPARHLATEEA